MNPYLLQRLEISEYIKSDPVIDVHSDRPDSFTLSHKSGVHSLWVSGTLVTSKLIQELKDYFGLGKPKLVSRLSKYFKNVREVRAKHGL